MSPAPATLAALADADLSAQLLGKGRIGTSGTVTAIRPHADHGLAASEIERLLLEMGFMEGSRVEILHEGPLGRDPIAVRVDNLRVAIRRNEANAILIQPDEA